MESLGAGTRSSLSVAWKLALAFVATAVVLALTREAVGNGVAPPVWLMLAWGAVVILCTGAALAAVVRWDLSLPWTVALYALGYNALVVAAKFVLAPHSIYLVNRTRPLTGLLTIDEGTGVLAVAALVFLLYAGVYAALFRVVRRRAGLPAAPARRRRISPRVFATIVIIGALLLAATTGGAFVFIAVVLAGAGVEYIEFVFSSGVSVLVALALGGAVWLAVRTFGTVAERAQAVGDATVLVSFFWVGLAFLALYHALWVLYMLILITLWPLRAVVPK